MVNPLGLALIFLLISTSVAIDATPCPNSVGWQAIGSTGDCILLSNNFYENYSQAENQCRRLGNLHNSDFHLAFLRDSLFTDQLVAAFNKDPNTVNSSDTYWIGARKNPADNRIVWLNGAYIDESYSPLKLLFEPEIASSAGEFGYLKLLETIDDSSNITKSRKVKNLQLRFDKTGATLRRALCARQSLAPPAPSSNIKISGGHCPMVADPANLTVHYIDGYCYVVVPHNTSNESACGSLAPNYRPAVLNDWTAQQVATVLADKRSLVIGLRFVPGRGWSWSSNNQAERVSVMLTAWGSDQPVGGQDCAAISNGTSMWHSFSCNSSTAGVSTLCQVAATSEAHSGSTVASFLLDKRGSCKPGFVHFDSSCYYFGKAPLSNYSSVADWCADNYNASALWIDRPAQLASAALLGLQPSRKYALDGLVPFSAGWVTLPSRLPIDNTSCLAFATGTGGLIVESTTEACAQLLPACRYPKRQTNEIKVDSSLLGVKGANCPTGFTLVGRQCLAITSELSDWHTVKSACQSLFPSANLASLHAAIDNSVAKRLLTANKTSGAWIGLGIRRSSGLLYPTWSDASSFDYLPSNVTLVNNSRFQCAYVVSDDPNQGFIWRLTSNCSAERRYSLCQTAPTLSVPSAVVSDKSSTLSKIMTTQSPITTTPKVLSFSESCKSVPGQRLSDNGKRCYAYKVIKRHQNWFEAYNTCLAINTGKSSNLASIESESEDKHIRDLAATNGLVWLGLNEAFIQVPDQFTTWSDGTFVQYVNFDSSKPENYGQCAAMMTSSKSQSALTNSLLRSGFWYSRDCGEIQASVCKILIAEDVEASAPTPSSSINSYCPPDWIATPDNSTCYRLLAKPARYADARKQCQTLGGDLASYQTSGQHEFLSSLLAGLGRRAGLAWLGLEWSDGSFRWLDNSTVNFLVWPHAPALPSTHCLSIRYHPLLSDSGYHLAEPCSLPLPALCRRKRTLTPNNSKILKKSCPHGYTLFNSTWCYRFSNDPVDFQTAQANCVKDGTQLLWLESAFEVHFLRSLASSISNPPPTEIWFNLRSDTELINSLNWFDTGNSKHSQRPVKFDYIIPEWRHYNLDKLSGCYSYQLYNRATPAVSGLNRLSGGPAENCAKKKRYVCKTAASGYKAPPVTPTNNIGCYSVAKRYSGYASRSISGKECVRWDLARLIYEQLDVSGFYNEIHSKIAMNLLPSGSWPISAADVNLDADEDITQETLAEAANYCRSPPTPSSSVGSLNGLAKGAGRPGCFVRANVGDASKLIFEFCDLSACPGEQSSSTVSAADLVDGRRRGAVSVGVLTVIVLISALGVAGVGVLGFCVWKRGRWAAGYRPQLNLDASSGGLLADGGGGGGGTSFHNPIYMPANC